MNIVNYAFKYIYAFVENEVLSLVTNQYWLYFSVPKWCQHCIQRKLLPMKYIYWLNIALKLEIFAMKCYYYRNIGFALEIFI